MDFRKILILNETTFDKNKRMIRPDQLLLELPERK
ncbi:hypothetical protein FLACOL7796_02464 [Flavobacterium collinsii]|uniref:Uncharacterized protein n=1 Tax=Flavobacterium collinsii TaxID=1114861 RepID=A0ABN7EJX8_9FLAO|nr:hypothetical protein FLACOL7796_02464 [Flavobacterium collinsii]